MIRLSRSHVDSPKVKGLDAIILEATPWRTHHKGQGWRVVKVSIGGRIAYRYQVDNGRTLAITPQTEEYFGVQGYWDLRSI